MLDAAPLDPERIIRVLATHGVRYVLIGALAARLQGFPRFTADADITPERSSENVARLAAALRELESRVYTASIPEGLPFDCSAETLTRAELWNLVTSAGRLDIAFVPPGTESFADLVVGAVRFAVFGVELLAASLADIIRSKQAADRRRIDRTSSCCARYCAGKARRIEPERATHRRSHVARVEDVDEARRAQSGNPREARTTRSRCRDPAGERRRRARAVATRRRCERGAWALEKMEPAASKSVSCSSANDIPSTIACPGSDLKPPTRLNTTRYPASR